MTDAWAASGYVVIAPDLFWRLKPGVELDADIPDEFQEGLDLMQKFNDKGVEDLAASIAAPAVARLRQDRRGRLLPGWTACLSLRRPNRQRCYGRLLRRRSRRSCWANDRTSVSRCCCISRNARNSRHPRPGRRGRALRRKTILWSRFTSTTPITPSRVAAAARGCQRWRSRPMNGRKRFLAQSSPRKRGSKTNGSSAPQQRIAGAHQRHPDRTPLEDRVCELDWLEAGQPRPQPDVRRQRVPGLQTDEVLDRGHRRHRASLEQELAAEERSVQSTLGEHRSHASR